MWLVKRNYALFFPANPLLRVAVLHPTMYPNEGVIVYESSYCELASMASLPEEQHFPRPALRLET